MTTLENMDGLKRYTFDELKREMEEEDLLMNATLGVVIGGTMLDLMRLKKQIAGLPEFKVVYHTLTTAHLRLVKKDQYDEFLEWKRRGE